MRFSLRHLAALASLAAVGCQAGGATPALDTEDQQASYGFGLQVGEQFGQARSHLDIDAFMQGVRDAFEEVDPAVSQDEIRVAMDGFRTRVDEALEAEATASAERNTADGEAYMAKNGARDGVLATESGLQYEVLREGDGGARPADGQNVKVHYKGSLIDGTEFDSSYERGEPATFNVNQVIAGFSEGLKLMDVGSHYKFHIPGNLGYGPQGSPPSIQPNATLVFEVELIEIP